MLDGGQAERRRPVGVGVLGVILREIGDYEGEGHWRIVAV